MDIYDTTKFCPEREKWRDIVSNFRFLLKMCRLSNKTYSWLYDINTTSIHYISQLLTYALHPLKICLVPSRVLFHHHEMDSIKFRHQVLVSKGNNQHEIKQQFEPTV